MSDAEQQGLPFVPSAAPVLDSKAQRRPARVETAVFERAELVNPGNGQNGCTHYPGIRRQPIKLTRPSEEGPTGEMGDETETGPDCQIADGDECQ